VDVSTELDRYSKVSRRMWNDERFRALSPPQPNGQTLWKRLLTGPELTNIPGCFQAWDAGLAKALRWDLKAFLKAFDEVSSQGMAKADWEAGFVWVPNAISHNRPESPNVVRSWRATWRMLPECELKAVAYQELRAFMKGMVEGFLIAFDETCPKPSSKPCPNQEHEQEHEQEKVNVELPAPPKSRADLANVRKVFEFWQREHGHQRAKLDKARTARIRARLADGFTVHELCCAIRGAKQDDFLMGRDPKSNGTVYDDLESLLKSVAKVEKLMALMGKKRGADGPSPEAIRLRAEADARTDAESRAHQEALAASLRKSEAGGAQVLQFNDPKQLTGGIGG
jgi:hypothetical protein